MITLVTLCVLGFLGLALMQYRESTKTISYEDREWFKGTAIGLLMATFLMVFVYIVMLIN